MAKFRIYIEETSIRLLYTDVDAENETEANAQAQAALDDGTWPEWGGESSSECSLETREELTERIEYVVLRRRKAVR